MGVYKIKQYILIRKDLEMPAGKLGAQAAHASVGTLMKCAVRTDNLADFFPNKFIKAYEFTEDADKWLNGDFAKVCLAVKNEEELKKYYEIAKENNLPCCYIEDNGTTVFNGVKTATCVGVGPAKSEILEPLFKKLQLYK